MGEEAVDASSVMNGPVTEDRAQGHAQAVAESGPVVQVARGDELLVGRVAQDPSPVEGGEPGRHVGGAGAERPGRVGDVVDDEPLVLESVLAGIVPLHLPFVDLGLAAVVGALHPQRPEDPLFHVLLVGAPRDLLDDLPGQEEGRVVVDLVLTGGEVEGVGREKCHQAVGRYPPDEVRVCAGHLRVPADARRMVEELPHRDPVPLGREVRKVGSHLRVEVDEAFVLELEEGDGGELLRHGADLVNGVLGRGNVELQVRPSVSSDGDRLPVVDDGHGRAGDTPVPDRCHDHLVDGRHLFRVLLAPDSDAFRPVLPDRGSDLDGGAARCGQEGDADRGDPTQAGALHGVGSWRGGSVNVSSRPSSCEARWGPTLTSPHEPHQEGRVIQTIGRDRFKSVIACSVLAALAACGPGESSVPEATAAPAPEDHALSDSLAGWYAVGIGAHHLCAGLWVVGRDYERGPDRVVAEDISRFDQFRWEDDFFWTVDEAAREATVSSPRYGSRTAEYNGDQGCTLLPAGAENVFYQPRAVAPNLPDPATQDWPMGDRDALSSFPEVDESALEAAFEFAFNDQGPHGEQNTRGLVAVYRGKIIGERYREGWGPHTPQISWSMGKSIASALTGVLVQQGAYGLDDPAPVEEWREAPADPRREIRIRDLLRMSSGLDFDNFGLGPRRSYTAANEHMRIYFDALNVFRHAQNQPLRYEPGTVWRYRNSDPLTLLALAKEVMEDRGEDFLAFPQRHLFDRIGIRSAVLETDPWGNFIVSGYDYMSSRDWARFGLLHLWDGEWLGERVLPEGWSEFVSTPAPGDPSNGYGGLFWLNRGGAMDRLPPDAYWAAGFMGQNTVIIPSRDMVVVRQGPSAQGFGPYMNEVAGRILDAVESPESP